MYKLNLTTLLVIVFLILFIAPAVVYAYGVTRPLPYELELLRGESDRFKFQIQVVPSEYEKKCSYSIKEGFPLEVTFPETALVSPGQRKDIIGTITVPKNTNFGTYTGELCVHCEDAIEQAGTVVKQDVCGYPLKVNVVATRTRDNMPIPVEEKPFINTTMLIIGSIVFIVGLTIIILISQVFKNSL